MNRKMIDRANIFFYLINPIIIVGCFNIAQYKSKEKFLTVVSA